VTTDTPGIDEDALAWPDDAVEVGRIAGAWGVKGWIKVQTFASDPQALFSSKRWFAQPPDAANPLIPRRSETSGWPRLLNVTAVREHADTVVAQLQDVADRAAAEKLKGVRLFVRRSSFPSTESDEYYWVDLIGLSVFNRQDQFLGTVVGLVDTGPHSVLRLAAEPSTSPESERLIPFVAHYVDDVDVPGKRIVVDWALDY
jgi:16S rRNA processing protein RimM